MGKAPPEFLAQAVAAGFLPLRDHVFEHCIGQLKALVRLQLQLASTLEEVALSMSTDSPLTNDCSVPTWLSTELPALRYFRYNSGCPLTNESDLDVLARLPLLKLELCIQDPDQFRNFNHEQLMGVGGLGIAAALNTLLAGSASPLSASLTDLDLTGWDITTVPECFRHLSLCRLSLSCWFSLLSLPEWVGVDWKESLHTLDLSLCHSLTSLPVSLRCDAIYFQTITYIHT